MKNSTDGSERALTELAASGDKIAFVAVADHPGRMEWARFGRQVISLFMRLCFCVRIRWG